MKDLIPQQALRIRMKSPLKGRLDLLQYEVTSHVTVTNRGEINSDLQHWSQACIPTDKGAIQ